MPRVKKKRKKGILEGIRKPTAPPSRQFGEGKPEKKVHPAGRSEKHKRRDTGSTDDDI
jgi:hypothetical protein